MEPALKNLQFSIKHWAPYSRRFPSAFPLVTTNLVAQKKDWNERVYTPCAFSVILRGQGEYRHGDRVCPVVAPCVFIQWPGAYLGYGPEPGTTWSELYLVYEPSLLPNLQANGLMDLDNPVWPISDLNLVMPHVLELATLTRSEHPEDVADRVDRVAERLILETRLTPDTRTADDHAISTIAAQLRADLRDTPDLDEVAASHGMSPATFRRRWAAVMPVPPARYLQELRMREACRLLAETRLSIREIAAEVGFEDGFYFSRRFHQELGQTARDYRRIYRVRS